jgi:hypothetical protein
MYRKCILWKQISQLSDWLVEGYPRFGSRQRLQFLHWLPLPDTRNLYVLGNFSVGRKPVGA